MTAACGRSFISSGKQTDRFIRSRAVFIALYADDSLAFTKDVSWTPNLIPGGCCCLDPALNTGY